MHPSLSPRLKREGIDTHQGVWLRQRKTAADILRRLQVQEGVILADQVGMGKTYVALAVAVSELLATPEPGQVLVLAPPAVAQKWVNEWADFSSNLLGPGVELRCAGPIRSGEALLAALDDPPERRRHLLVATHGALNTSLKDTFIHLALLRAATLHRHEGTATRELISRWSIGLKGLIPDRRLNPERVGGLLAVPPTRWRAVWASVSGEQLEDDPVPSAVVDALNRIDLTELRDVLSALPKRASNGLQQRLSSVRAQLKVASQELWRSVLSSIELELPLLVVDEAHRLKNDHTQVSRLFAPRSDNDTTGVLTGAFERILLLTATPFELGHDELIRVLSRLRAARSSPVDSPPLDARLESLRTVLHSAQAAAIELDQKWSSVQETDLHLFEDWTPDAEPPANCAPTVAAAWRAAGFAAKSRRRMHTALRPWIIRHERPRRRRHNVGAAVLVTDEQPQSGGLVVPDETALPFLLAARAQAIAAEDRDGTVRPHFAYGIASSFDAFLRLGTGHPELDSDADSADPDLAPHATQVVRQSEPAVAATDWYRREIVDILLGGAFDRAEHPKVRATVDRALHLWSRGQKCLIFCWYIATGRAVEEALATRIGSTVVDSARVALDLGPEVPADEVRAALVRTSDRLLRSDTRSYERVTSSLRGFFRSRVTAGGQNQSDLVDGLCEAAVRQARRPEFLVRYTPLAADLSTDGLLAGLRGSNPIGIAVLNRWGRFADRLSRAHTEERGRVLGALLGDRSTATNDTADQSGGASLDTVRRAHGGTNRDVRERLTAMFNTPLAPDLLVASSVMGEGIDLHLECRHVIHHDLDWNPSVLEQRTGRLDRVGALTEYDDQPIEVFEPYLAGTHDEKMFRVVRDRAGWFDVVMGRAVGGDERATDREEKRVPLAEPIASALTMNLES